MKTSPPRVSGKTRRPGKRVGAVFIPRVSEKSLLQVHASLRAALVLQPEMLTKERLAALEAYAFKAGSAADFRVRYLDAVILKRWQASGTEGAERRRETAVAKLLESEIRCKYANMIFTGPEALSWSNTAIPVHLLKVYQKARRIIAQMVGETVDLNALADCVEFSSGATTEFPRREARPTNKWANSTHVTSLAKPYAEAFRKWCGPHLSSNGEDQAWPEFKVIRANEVFTVPKRFDADRTACKGGSWNVALQKGYATSNLRAPARRWFEPLLLPDSQAYHGLLAKLGSVTGSLTTGDLSGASDGVGVGHVRTFFPEAHARVMEDLREPGGLLPDGTTVSWEKIGSMGNGFTFEAETIFFYAVVKACCKRDELVSVYGDDLIYPTRRHELVTEALSFLGLEFNREKTFTGSSPFRESCGAYYWRGVDVKPFYLESWPRTMLELIQLHNDILVWGRDGMPEKWHAVLDACRSAINPRFFGPLGVPGCAWVEWDEARPVYHPKKQAFSYECLTQRVKTDPETEIGGYLLSLEVKNKRERNRCPTRRDIAWTRGALTGPPLSTYLQKQGGTFGVPKGMLEVVITRGYVDRVQWRTLSRHNIDVASRDAFLTKAPHAR